MAMMLDCSPSTACIGGHIKPGNSSDPETDPSNLNDRTSWCVGDDLYFYGGTLSTFAQPMIVPPTETWKHNIGNDNWTRNDFNGVPITRLADCLIAQSFEKKALYLGGIVSLGGDPNL
ncbi:hypothetical protein BO94DRAFT_579473 [Aspergillus sclerotioniger CBS 115572]|uniref:Galactose oxidase n=1 Tax=Aspergillus sclerotioniger CBS 115572 TaxID=1450535 RepID=A0A317V607_9EURO|nr:hypothetical protein BO94DRAFT_579473 [Aspergillus sclerotioniger CBS 115572]PWY67600.1 hypothetical protein BO94DRAFT_579473 [Aspergillus sclerotioniger CBS 115572]